ncbi:MAG: hypothetical protein Q8R63_07725 [Ramlibacter sp.]|nr:hypothetical protein [Ramlibacter sp.]
MILANLPEELPPAPTVSPAQFASACLEYNVPAALLAALEKFDYSKAEFVAASGFEEAAVDAWFKAGGIDLNEYLGAGQNDWGMEEVLATSGLSQGDLRTWALDNLDDPMLLAQSVWQCGASAEVVAEIVGCTASDVTSYFANAGLGDYYAYFC